MLLSPMFTAHCQGQILGHWLGHPYHFAYGGITRYAGTFPDTLAVF